MSSDKPVESDVFVEAAGDVQTSSPKTVGVKSTSRPKRPVDPVGYISRRLLAKALKGEDKFPDVPKVTLQRRRIALASIIALEKTPEVVLDFTDKESSV